MRFPRRIVSMALGPLVFALSGCATITSQQQSARAAWDGCPKAANLALASIEPNGLVHYRAASSQSGSRELAECLRSSGVSSDVIVAAAP